MKTIKVFVASSIIEFEQERIYLGEYVRKLNDSFRDLKQRIRLYLCEDEKINSQPFYDRNIEDSDAFISIIGDQLGEFTKHEILVANHSTSIKRKIIVLTLEKSKNLLPNELRTDFEIHIIKDDLKNSLINLLSDIIEDTIQEKNEEQEEFTLDAFTLNLPNADSIDVAVINNIIRRLRDQDHNIIVHDIIDGSERAYIALLSDSIKSEITRINGLIEQGISSEQLWLYADNGVRSIGQLQNLYNVIVNKVKIYPDDYDNWRKLSNLIEIKLLRSLDEQNQVIAGGFIYIVEDHWLIRKSLITQKKHLFVNLCDIDGNMERKDRKERIIVNLLNQYWLSGRWDKHIDSITKLLQSDFDSFTYSLDDLNKLKFEEYGQGFYDYFCDIAENIQREALTHDSQWVKQKMEEQLSLLHQRQFLLNPNDIKKAYLIIGNTYSIYQSLTNQAVEFYIRLIKTIDGESGEENNRFSELVKNQILILCFQKFCESDINEEEIYRIAESALHITKEDEFYFAVFKIIQYEIIKDIATQESFEAFLFSILKDDFASPDNIHLFWFLIFYVRYIQNLYNRNVDISAFIQRIEYYIQLYHRYLSFDSKYRLIYETLSSKKALATKDEELVSMILNEYPKYHEEYNKHYFDILYDKGTICLKNKKIEQAIQIFSHLQESYSGKHDKAASLQSLALCYMEKYNETSNLTKAESAYLQALELYSSLKDKRMCGNVWDGLSYCYILEKEFEKAEKASLEALGIDEYTTPNKHSNYISSLLCQKKQTEAILYYNSLLEKESVKKQLLADWASEMRGIGINTDNFREIFGDNQ